MIKTDFSTHLSEYGFPQLAGRVQIRTDMGQRKQPHPQFPENVYSKELSQKGDVYSFGLMILDILGGTDAVRSQELRGREGERN